MSPNIFQKVMDTMLAGLDFAVAYLDDVLIKRETRWQHSEHTQEVFQTIEDYRFKLSEENTKF